MTKHFGFDDEWTAAEAVLNAHPPRLLIYGPPGTGKSYLAQNYGLANPKTDGYAVTLTEETPAAEIRGHFLRKGDESPFHNGVGVRAWTDEWTDASGIARVGKRLVINEIDYASPDVLAILMALLDGGHSAALTLPNGNTVHPGADFHAIATMNGEPSDLPGPLQDRFPVKLRITKPHPAGIDSLPADLRDPARESVKVAPDDSRYISLRGWNAFAEYREAMDTEKAAYLVFGDNAEDVLLSLKVATGKPGATVSPVGSTGGTVKLKRGRVSDAEVRIITAALSASTPIGEIITDTRRSEKAIREIAATYGYTVVS